MIHTNSKRILAALTGLLMISTSAYAEMVYKRGTNGEPETLDPQKTSTVIEGNLSRDLFEGFMIRDAAGKLGLGIAESYKISDDGLTYTFKLKPNLKWSDGTPFTADDMVYSFRRTQLPETASQYANLLFCIDKAEDVNGGKAKPEELGVKALDPSTVEIKLNAPTPYFIELMAHMSSLPVPKHVIEKFGNDWVKPGNMVSNGAFVMTENVPHDHITIVKNPNYYDAAHVKLDKELVLPTEDRAAGLRRFQAGEFDSYDEIPTDQIKYIRTNLKDEWKTGPYLGTYYFPVNTQKAPFNDVRVRNALSLMVDREFLAEEIWGGTMLPGYSFVPPGIGTYGDPSWWPYKDLSPAEREEKAKALLKEAGYGPGLKPLKIEIRFNTSENHKKTSIALADMWKPLGVEVSLVNTDLKTHYAYLRDAKNDYDIARAGWIADYNDPQNFLFLNLQVSKSFNYARYNNPDYDAIIAKSDKEGDLKKRDALLHQAEAILMKDEPNITLLTYMSKNLVSKKVKGWAINTTDEHPSRYISIE